MVGTVRCAVPAGAVPVLAGGICPAEDGKAPDSNRRSAPVATFSVLAGGIFRTARRSRESAGGDSPAVRPYQFVPTHGGGCAGETGGRRAVFAG
jgi:hypothetical protein